jgi:hypothetical protein
MLVSATIILVGAATTLQFTEVCRLNAVTLDGKPLPNWQGKFGLSTARLVTDQPIDLLATELLGSDGVVKVDVRYDLPGTVAVRTNDYTAVAFLVDRTLGETWGLDQFSRIVPLKESQIDWEHPFFTGLVAGQAYGACEDLRVSVALTQLSRLAADQPESYKLVSEINFSSKEFLLVSLDGIPTGVKVYPDGLARQVTTIVNFILGHGPDLGDARALDTRFEKLVVKECIPDTTKKDSTKARPVMEAYD